MNPTTQKWREDNLVRPRADHPDPQPWQDIATPAPKPGTRLCAMPNCFTPATGLLCEGHAAQYRAMEDET